MGKLAYSSSASPLELCVCCGVTTIERARWGLKRGDGGRALHLRTGSCRRRPIRGALALALAWTWVAREIAAPDGDMGSSNYFCVQADRRMEGRKGAEKRTKKEKDLLRQSPFFIRFPCLFIYGANKIHLGGCRWSRINRRRPRRTQQEAPGMRAEKHPMYSLTRERETAA